MKTNPGWEGLGEWLDEIEAAPAPKCVITVRKDGSVQRETVAEYHARAEEESRERWPMIQVCPHISCSTFGLADSVWCPTCNKWFKGTK